MSRNHIITLTINKYNRISIEITDVKKQLTCDDWSKVTLYSNNSEIPLRQPDTALSCFRKLTKLLTQILDEGKKLHPEITENLGFLWDEILEGRRKKFPYTMLEGRRYWVGQNYLLWSMPRQNTTWLYAKSDKIFLEVTPSYPWTFVDPKEGEKFFTFDEFIKNYKPYAIFEISKETARAWQKEAQEIVDIILKNHEKLCGKHNA